MDESSSRQNTRPCIALQNAYVHYTFEHRFGSALLCFKVHGFAPQDQHGNLERVRQSTRVGQRWTLNIILKTDEVCSPETRGHSPASSPMHRFGFRLFPGFGLRAIWREFASFEHEPAAEKVEHSLPPFLVCHFFSKISDHSATRSLSDLGFSQP